MSDVAATDPAPAEATPQASTFDQFERPSAVRKPPLIAPEMVKLDADGFVIRGWFIRLPKGFQADDLKEPSLWSRVQGDQRKALRQFDKLLLVAYDEDWLAEAIVVRATGATAVLSRPRIVSIGERYERLFEDENFRVRWVGSGYIVERKLDGRRMSHIAATIAVAERDLRNMYPKPTGA